MSIHRTSPPFSQRSVMTLILFLMCLICVTSAVQFGDVTDKKFDKTIQNGVLAAFGDFNSDKDTDLFVITNNGKSLSLYLAQIEGPFTRHLLVPVNHLNGSMITSVVPTDFDGDSQMDVLLTTINPANEVTVSIWWGTAQSINLDQNPLIIPEKLKDQPLVMDADGDLLPDIFGESVDGTRRFWIMSKYRNVTAVELTNGTSRLPPIRHPQSSAFADLDGDLTADLLIASRDSDNKMQLEFWFFTDGQFQWKETVPVPYDEPWKEIGQITIADIDQDTKQELLIPVCEDDECKKSNILVYKAKQWHTLLLDTGYKEEVWGFVPMSRSIDSITTPITLRVGDVNLDGYPDILTTLYTNTNGTPKQEAFILDNVRCASSDCATLGRTFSVYWETALTTAPGQVMLPAFYDLDENGNLDIIMTTYTGKPEMRIFQRTSLNDGLFLKVLVIRGYCNRDCPHGDVSYGLNIPGPTTQYYTVSAEGGAQVSASTQLCQSAYFSLQLPYTIFGLGDTPNFIEDFSVGIPHQKGQKKLSRSWTYIIPNTQLIVIPHPQDKPQQWTNQLFITPSELVLLTGAALLGVCGLVAVIIGFLQWRERIEDKKEKLQEAQKFHFDAM